MALFGRKKTLSELNRQELRKEEILLTKQRDRLFKKIEDISGAKQKIFQQGATQKSPELRKALAQEFELKTQEQLMSARELNLRSKELLTVSRLRMVKENGEKGSALGRLNLTDKDVARITGFWTAPRRDSAAITTSDSRNVGSCHDTTVPGPMPRSRKAAATRSATSWYSDAVSERP